MNHGGDGYHQGGYKGTPGASGSGFARNANSVGQTFQNGGTASGGGKGLPGVAFNRGKGGSVIHLDD